MRMHCAGSRSDVTCGRGYSLLSLARLRRHCTDQSSVPCMVSTYCLCLHSTCVLSDSPKDLVAGRARFGTRRSPRRRRMAGACARLHGPA